VKTFIGCHNSPCNEIGLELFTALSLGDLCFTTRHTFTNMYGATDLRDPVDVLGDRMARYRSPEQILEHAVGVIGPARDSSAACFAELLSTGVPKDQLHAVTVAT